MPVRFTAPSTRPKQRRPLHAEPAAAVVLRRHADSAIPPIVKAFNAALATVRDGIDQGDLLTVLTSRQIGHVLDRIPFDLFVPAFKAAFVPILRDLLLAGGKAALPDFRAALLRGHGGRRRFDEPDDTLDLALPLDLSSPTVNDWIDATPAATVTPNATVSIAFDLHNPEAVRWIDAHAGDLIREIDGNTQLAIQQLVHRSFAAGIPPDALARQIRATIGLTAYQETAVANYQAFLQGLVARGDLSDLGASQADRLARGLINRTQVGPIRRDGLDPMRVDDLVDGYRQRLVNERATNIARTESLSASNHGQQALWDNAATVGLIDASRTTKVFIVTDDDRLCDLCAEMDGQEVGVDEDFDSPDGPIDAPPIHSQCRCTFGLGSVAMPVGLTLAGLDDAA